METPRKTVTSANSDPFRLSVSAGRRDVIGTLQAGVDGYLVEKALGDRPPELVSEALDGSMPVSPQTAGPVSLISNDPRLANVSRPRGI